MNSSTKSRILMFLMVAGFPMLFVSFIWVLSLGAFNLLEALRSVPMVAIDILFTIFAILLALSDDFYS